MARISTDYHVEVERYFYSVPHRFIRQHADVRSASRTIEVFRKTWFPFKFLASDDEDRAD
ncbi:Mu transposase domain-containing protein [Agrobacterium tumefaciens]|uniref:Mu transposase domain-containing protein n=1 Tax=Agrobacterium tumefaciens TaxID=358 RepID=UPI003D09527C